MDIEHEVMAQQGIPAHFESGAVHYSPTHRAEGLPDVCRDIIIKRGRETVGVVKTGFVGQTTLDAFVPEWRKHG